MSEKLILTKKYHSKSKGPNYEVNLYIDLNRFEKNFSRAQYKLDNMVMTDMIPYMPMQTGSFINVTRAMSQAIAGSGRVVAAAPPYGRFLYNGKVMVDEITGSPWARPGAKKMVTDRDIEFSNHAHPNAQSHWFEAAKKNHGDSWAAYISRIVRGAK